MLLLLSSALAETRELGKLVLDGVPEIPAAVTESLRPYAEIRSAGLFDFDPRGNGILISTRFGETSQVHRVAAPGGDRRQLSFFAEPVAGAAYDPARAGGVYLVMDQGGGEFFQFYWYDLVTGTRALLTDGRSRNTGFALAPKGGRFAYSSTRRNGKDTDLWLQEGLDPASARMITAVEGDWTVTGWSPDESRLVVQHELSVTDSELAIVDLASGKMEAVDPARASGVAWGGGAFSGDGKAIYATTDEGSEFKYLVKVDLATRQKTKIWSADWDVSNFALSPDGRWLAWEVNEGGRSRVWLARADKPEKARALDLPLGVVGGIGFDRRSTRLGLSMSTTDSASDVWVADLAGAVTRWTFSETGGLDPSRFIAPSLVEYPSFDGRKIPAWLTRPPGSGKVPVLIAIHGGPEAQATASFSPNVQYWVNELGLAVLQPNVRGSTGYGKTYTQLDNGMLRMDSVKDIGALLDWIARQPDLDAGRVAVLGGSYGGFMTLASLVEYGDRLRCGVDNVGISNFVSFLERTEAYRRDLRRVEYGDERIPEMRAFQEKIAPANQAQRINRPLLVGQGKNDPRVPQSEAEQIVARVREAGGSAWYVLAQDEGHGFKKKSNRQAWSEITSVFLDRCLIPAQPETMTPSR